MNPTHTVPTEMTLFGFKRKFITCNGFHAVLCMYVHAYVHTYVCMYISTDMLTYVLVYTYVRTYVYTYVGSSEKLRIYVRSSTVCTYGMYILYMFI